MELALLFFVKMRQFASNSKRAGEDAGAKGGAAQRTTDNHRLTTFWHEDVVD